MDNCLIRYDDVTIKYGHYEAVKNISFTVNKYDFLNIIGPNGAGKTTLIKSLINQIKPSSGKVFRQTNLVGYVPQKQFIKRNFPLTVLEFIYTGTNDQKFIISNQIKKEILEWVLLMGLDPLIMDEKINKLSGGELQRVYFIRGIISKPELLILDEPASALDPSFREQFYDILKQIKAKEQMTIIHITHDLTDVVLKNSLVLHIDQEMKFFGTYLDYKSFEHEGHNHG